MKDAIFSGPDVPAAVEAAARALGLRPDQFRYVVLDAGTPGRLGLQAQPARIAVLMDAGRGASAGAPPAASEPEEEELADDLPERIRDLGRRLAEETGLELALSVAEDQDRVEVRLEGAGLSTFLGDAGVGPALEHLLRRWADRGGYELGLSGLGGRERRDEALRQRALQLADAVRVDGQPRRLEGLNSYERRIVHMALQEAPGVETFSVGEGADRRVVIAPRVSTAEED